MWCFGERVGERRTGKIPEPLQKKHKLTYIFISHDMALVRKVCHRVAVMYLGRIVELADNETLFANPAHPYSGLFIKDAVPLHDTMKIH